MTLGTVNSQAANFPRSTSNRRLIDRLIGAAVAHFEEFSSR